MMLNQGGPYGENLAAGYADGTAAVEGWGNERSEYDFDAQEFSKETGHFTQLVWKNTELLGCGRARCGGGGQNAGEDEVSGWYVVCEYYPPGNVQGAFGGNVQDTFAGNDQDTFAGNEQETFAANEQDIFAGNVEARTTSRACRNHWPYDVFKAAIFAIIVGLVVSE